jgi:DHA2 family multidrug resistance protein
MKVQRLLSGRGSAAPLRSAALTETELRWMTFSVVLASWMALLDGTVINVGLDTIAGNLGATVNEAVWIGSIYSLAALFVLPLSGWFATNVGRKRTFLIAIAVFTGGSLLCAFCTTLPQLIAMRFLQGLGGGLMVPMAVSALVDAYPPSRLPTAFKVYGTAAMVAPALGPAVGGWTIANFSWPWIFLINVPIGLFAFALASAVMPEQSTRGERSPFDWMSLLVLMGGMFALQYVIQEGPSLDWFSSPAIIGGTAAAVLLVVVFVRTQLTARVPLVDLRPLRIPTYSLGVILALVTGVGFTGTALVCPLYMQDVLKYGADYAGLIMIPSAIGGFIGTELSGRLSSRMPPALLAAAALIISATGTFWFAFLGDRAGFDHTLIPRFVQGIGLGLLYVPLNVLLMSRVPRHLVDAASGISGLTRQLGYALGFAILGTVVVHAQIATTSVFGARARQGTVLTDPGLAHAYRWFLGRGFADADAQAFSSSVVGELVNRAATTAAYSETFIIVGMLFVASLPCLLLLYLARGARTTAA